MRASGCSMPGLADKVTIKMQDYRDETGIYDRIASIEMIEAVGEQFWPDFFRQMSDRLVAGGIAGIQAITIQERFFLNYRREIDYIRRYVFPGGMLPSPTILKSLGSSFGIPLVREKVSATIMRARSRCGATVSAPHGPRSCRSASTSASGGCGNITSLIAKPGSCRGISTCGR